MKVLFSFLSCLWAGILFSTLYTSCGSPKASDTIVIEDNEPDIVTCSGGDRLGATKTLECPTGQAGKILQVCSAQSKDTGEWVQLDDSCTPIKNECQTSAQGKTTFAQVKPLIEKYCVSCHYTPENYGDYEVAKELMSSPRYDMLYAITRLDSGRMPKGGEALDPKDINVFKDWLADGLIEGEECADNDSQGNEFLQNSLEYIEDKILNDIKRLQDDDDRANARYLVIGNNYNERPEKAAYDLFIKAIGKSANTLSLEENISLPAAIDARKTIFRINLEDFNLDEDIRFGSYSGGYKRTYSNGWDLVLNAEPFKMESFTVAGEVIKDLTQTNFPWLHAENFAFIAHSDDNVYYSALDIPDTVDQLFIDLGVNFQELIDAEEIICTGGNGSEISQQKNRLLCRIECERSVLCKANGYVWITFDPIDLDGVPERDLFSNPLLADFRLDSNFDFAASEWIFTLPNGMQGYYLANAAGARQAEAPLNVVNDTGNGAQFGGVIETAISCHECHSKGLIPFKDQIRPHVENNATQFDQDVREKVFAVFPKERALSAQFKVDNDKHNAALKRLKIDLKDPDPINFLTNPHRQDWTAKKFCAFMLLSLNECKRRIEQSDIVKVAVGALLTEGGLVSRNQVIDNIANIKIGMRFGLEVNGQ